MTSLLHLHSLHVGTPGTDTLLRDVNLSLERGQRLALLGPSGSGKTTLLRAVLDDLPPGFVRTGTLTVNGTPIDPGTRHARRVITDTIAYLPQDAGASLTPTMRIRSLLKEALPPGNTDRTESVREALVAVGLPADARFLGRRTWQLSGGQQRRVALARALARHRPLLLLDEPTAGLDPDSRRQVLSLLENLSSRLSSALLLVTHDVEAAEALGCERHHFTTQERPRRQRLVAASTARSQQSTPVLAMKRADIVVRGGATVVTHSSLKLSRGEVTLLRGDSGTGKSTLARALAGLHPLKTGHIELHGHSIPASIRRRTTQQKRAIQITHQSAHDAFNPTRTIAQSLADVHPTTDPTRFLAPMLLETEMLHRYPHELSGGQRQRFALLRALATTPDALILDEPTSALDDEAAHHVLGIIRDTANTGTAILLITHDTELDHHADQIVAISNGVLHATATG